MTEWTERLSAKYNAYVLSERFSNFSRLRLLNAILQGGSVFKQAQTVIIDKIANFMINSRVKPQENTYFRMVCIE